MWYQEFTVLLYSISSDKRPSYEQILHTFSSTQVRKWFQTSLFAITGCRQILLTHICSPAILFSINSSSYRPEIIQPNGWKIFCMKDFILQVSPSDRYCLLSISNMNVHISSNSTNMNFVLSFVSPQTLQPRQFSSAQRTS